MSPAAEPRSADRVEALGRNGLMLARASLHPRSKRSAARARWWCSCGSGCKGAPGRGGDGVEPIPDRALRA